MRTLQKYFVAATNGLFAGLVIGTVMLHAAQ